MHIFPSNYLTISISTQNLHTKVFLINESEAQNKNEWHKIVSHKPMKNEQASYFKKKLLVRSDRRHIQIFSHETSLTTLTKNNCLW